MASSTYDDALRRLLRHEGGYANHPSDPGGPTNFGITIADYRAYVKAGATAADVRAMRLGEAKSIYRTKYWRALRCDELPAGLDYAVFDYGVNSGVARAAKVLQRLVGFPDDGRLTDALLAAVRKRDPSLLIGQLCAERLAFLKRLKTWPVFGAGWQKRVAEVRAGALAMAQARRVPEAQAAAAPGKGIVPVNRMAQQTSAGGSAAVGTTAAVQAHQLGAGPALVLLIIVVATALAVSGWLVWRWRQRQLQEA
jgi:lysozyme family protein